MLCEKANGFVKEVVVNNGKNCGYYKSCTRRECKIFLKRSKRECLNCYIEKATVKIQVISAYVDDEDILASQSDVFVQVKVYDTKGIYKQGEIIAKTSTIENNNRPVWNNEPIIITKPIPITSRIRLELFDFDQTKTNDFLGYVELSVSELRKKSGQSIILRNIEGEEMALKFLNSQFIVEDSNLIYYTKQLANEAKKKSNA